MNLCVADVHWSLGLFVCWADKEYFLSFLLPSYNKIIKWKQTPTHKKYKFSEYIKDVFDSFFYFRQIILYLHTYRKLNADNKLIKTVGHRARFFRKMMLKHTRLCQQVWLYLDIFIFSLIKSLSCNKTLKTLGLQVVCINRMSLYKMFT